MLATATAALANVKVDFDDITSGVIATGDDAWKGRIRRLEGQVAGLSAQLEELEEQASEEHQPALTALKERLAAIQSEIDRLTSGEADEKEKARCRMVETQLAAAAHYAERLSADAASEPIGHVFFNGKHLPLDDDLMRNVQVGAAQAVQHFQEQVRLILS